MTNRPPRLALLACVIGLAAALVGLTAAAATNQESPHAARHGFAFALMGDQPSRPGDETVLNQMLAQFGLAADLAIHTGNFKGKGERCDDAVYSHRRKLLDASPIPLVLTPGENDWANCDLTAAGQFGPIERLARLRDLFFEPDDSLGMLKLSLQRQSETVRFRGYPENARWEYGGILFVTVNVPGNHNNYRNGAGRNGEYEERIQADTAWLRQAFAMATRLKTRGIVVAFSADPRFSGRRDSVGTGTDPYATLKTDLARLASRYAGQILIVHGGNTRTTTHRPDQPLRVNGKPLANTTRVTTYGAARPGSWIKVSVEPRDRNVFKIETMDTVLQPPIGPPPTR